MPIAYTQKGDGYSHTVYTALKLDGYIHNDHLASYSQKSQKCMGTEVHMVHTALNKHSADEKK